MRTRDARNQYHGAYAVGVRVKIEKGWGISVYLIWYGCLNVAIPQDQPVQRLIIRSDGDLVSSRRQELLLEAQAIEQYRRSLLIQCVQFLSIALEEEVIEAPAMAEPSDLLRLGAQVESNTRHQDEIQGGLLGVMSVRPAKYPLPLVDGGRVYARDSPFVPLERLVVLDAVEFDHVHDPGWCDPWCRCQGRLVKIGHEDLLPRGQSMPDDGVSLDLCCGHGQEDTDATCTKVRLKGQQLVVNDMA